MALRPAPVRRLTPKPGGDPAFALRELLGVGRKDWRTTDQIAEEFQFPTAAAVRMFLRRHRLFDEPRVVLKRGRTVLVDRDAFERMLPRLRATRAEQRRRAS